MVDKLKNIFTREKLANRKSFKLERKIDRPKLNKLPGSWWIIKQNSVLLKKQWKTFGGLGIIFIVLYIVFVEGFARINLAVVQESLNEYNLIDNALGEASLLTTSVLANSSSADQTGAIWANVLVIIFGIFFIWSARQFMAGNRIKIRDALYNGMAAFPSVIIVLLVMFVQTLPLLIGLFLYVEAQNSGLINGGAEAMVLFIVMLLGSLLTLFWITSSIIGLMAATLQGVYPLAALRAGKELVEYRRIQVFVRVFVMVALILAIWFLTLLVTVSNSVTSAIVTEIILILRAFTLIFGVLYLYRLYRELINAQEKDEQVTSK